MERVAIIVGKMHAGGKKNLVMEYYRHINKDKYQFDFICDNDSNSIPEEEILSLGGRVYKVTPYQRIVRHMIDVRRIFRNNKYRIVHCYDNLMNLFPLVLAKRAGIKVRISESISTGNKGETQYIAKSILRHFSKCGANYLMANSKESAIFQFGEKKYNAGQVDMFKTIIDCRKNAYNQRIRQTTRLSMGWKDNEYVFGFIGRFVEQKNPLFLMEVFREILKIEKNSRFVVVGHGKMEKQILKKAEEYEMGEHFVFLGKTENIIPLYNAFDSFILPSLYEGMPVVGLEAQCAGLPTIMSDVITEETKACSLAHFYSLKESAKSWADFVLKVTKENVNNRKSYHECIIDAGFDSEVESMRLERYYDQALDKEYK